MSSSNLTAPKKSFADHLRDGIDLGEWALQYPDLGTLDNLACLNELPYNTLEDPMASTEISNYPGQIDVSQSDQRNLYGTQTFPPLATQNTSATSSMASQIYQQPYQLSGVPDLNSMQEPQSRDQSFVLPYGENNRPYSYNNSNIHASMDMSTISSGDYRNMSSVPMPLTLNDDTGGDLFGLHHHAAFNPLPLGDYTQEPSHLHYRFKYPSLNNVSDTYQPVQPATASITNTLPWHNSPVSNLPEHDQQCSGTSLGANPYATHMHPPLVQNYRMPFSANGAILPLYNTTESCNDALAALAIPIFSGSNNHVQPSTSSTTQPYLPSFANNNQSTMPDLDKSHFTVFSPTCQTNSVVARTSRKTGRSIALTGTVKSGISLDGQHIYKNPKNEREYNKTRKRTRAVKEKAAWACFACWITHQKCKHSHVGPCGCCRELMRKNAYHASFPKFTCDVRTKLSEMNELFPELVGSEAILLQRSIVEDAVTLLVPLWQLLDTIEPRRARQIILIIDKSETRVLAWFLSYGFDVIRWREAILFFDPSLQHHVDSITLVYRRMLRMLLMQIDDIFLYHNKYDAAVMLNVMHEAIPSLDSRHTADRHKLNHFQAALEDRISQLYCMWFSTLASIKTIKGRKQAHTKAKVLASFSRTTKLLPPTHRDCLPGVCDEYVLKTQNCTSEGFFSLPATLLNHCETSTSCFPGLSQYVPARFSASFDIDAKLFCCRRQDVNEHIYKMLKGAEDYLHTVIARHTLLVQLMLILAPHALSIIAKLVFDESLIAPLTACPKFCIYSIILFSITLCRMFLEDLLPRTKEEIRAWISTWPLMSTAMYTWARTSNEVQTLRGVLKSLFAPRNNADLVFMFDHAERFLMGEFERSEISPQSSVTKQQQHRPS